jgi:hypothetical protein
MSGRTRPRQRRGLDLTLALVRMKHGPSARREAASRRSVRTRLLYSARLVSALTPMLASTALVRCHDRSQDGASRRVVELRPGEGRLGRIKRRDPGRFTRDRDMLAFHSRLGGRSRRSTFLPVWPERTSCQLSSSGTGGAASVWVGPLCRFEAGGISGACTDNVQGVLLRPSEEDDEERADDSEVVPITKATDGRALAWSWLQACEPDRHLSQRRLCWA